MQEITREQAELMMDTYRVLRSKVFHENHALVVAFNLSNQQWLRICYFAREAIKKYFLNGTPAAY
jgi:hypothetical protein